MMSSGSIQKTDYEKVLEFTRETGNIIPDKPVPMNLQDVEFISKMIIDELLELFATVTDSGDAKNTIISQVNAAKDLDKESYSNESDQVAEQADALVDVYYYMLNSACKKNINISEVFNLVHEANMNKRDPETGTFIRRSDGKVMKPPGWTAPDIRGLFSNKFKKD
jgi:predicted HAD superfamily Cof-like phosphohydrolase